MRDRRDDADDESEDEDEDTLFIFDGNSMPIGDTAMLDEDDDGVGDSPAQADQGDTDDDTEELDGIRATYDPANEPYPEFAVYDKGTPKITTDVIKVPQKVLDILQQHDCETTQFLVQHDAAVNLLEIPSVKRYRIALLGNAGAGKSSLINSLVDVRDLAKSVSSGHSCTCVPTEYAGPYPGQTRDYAAWVHYFDTRKTRSMFKELLWDYNLYEFERDNTWSTEIDNAFKSRSVNAFKIFRTLFCDHAEFKGYEISRRTLKKAYKKKDNKIIEMMMEATEKLLKDKIRDKGYTEWRGADTPKKLQNKLEPLLSSQSTFDQPALWPLIQQVCIFARGSRILKDITLIDLPGISDTNESRVNLAKEYVKTCDYVWIVAHISRAVEDSTVRSLISTYGQAFKGDIAVICTHSDSDIAPALADDLKRRGRDLSGYQKVGIDMRAKKAEIAQAPSASLWADMASLKTQRFACLVKARNDLIAEGLQEEAEYYLPQSSSLDVFCVSNLHYAVARGFAKLSDLKLDAASTGIPALRSFTLALPAQRLFRLIHDYLSSVVVFLQNLSLWVNKTSVDRRRGFMQHAKRPNNTLKKHLDDLDAECRRILRNIITTPVCALRQRATEAALVVTAQKNTRHHSTILAFIRKNGQYATRVCAQECWNEEFLKIISDKVISAWPALEDGLNIAYSKLEEQVFKDLREMIKTLRRQSYSALIPIDKLNKLIEDHVLGINRMFNKEAEDLERDLRNIQLDVTQHSNKNFFSRTLMPVYDDCNNDYGKGVTDRSMVKIENHLRRQGESSPFTIVARKTTAAIDNALVKVYRMRIEKNLRKIYQDIWNVCDRTIERDLEDPTERPVIQHLKKEFPAINEKFERITEDFERIKKAYGE